MKKLSLSATVIGLSLSACSQTERLAQPEPAIQTPPAVSGAPAPVAEMQAQAIMTKSLRMEHSRLMAAAPAGYMPMADWQPPPESREKYQHFSDNPVKLTTREAVSTLSLDVDTGAYSNVRRFLNQGQLPPQDAVRVEELVNYFPYAYPQANNAHPFALSTELAAAPWNKNHLLLRVGVKAVEKNMADMPPANLVFLVDVSGSMEAEDKLPLVRASLMQLVDQLRAQDKVSLVVYAGRTAVELEPTAGSEKAKIKAAIARLQAGGSTAGEAAIKLAYAQARAGFIKGGINRILLATDGDFNVGVSDMDQLKGMVERERQSGVSLTTLGYGQGNYNEALMEQLAQVGNGNYGYIDSLSEARKVLVEELSSTFNTVAADVKLQLEFNSASVAEWRLIGYENRLLNEADFKNDKVDAVEVGAGKSVTALYEITPVGENTLHGERRYSQAATVSGKRDELGFLKVRYKKPGEAQSTELSQALKNSPSRTPGTDWQFAAAVAGFGQLLRGGSYTGAWTYADAKALAQAGQGSDPQGYRRDFVRLVELAQSLSPAAAETLGQR